jgi:inactivated superfamily I helicase
MVDSVERLADAVQAARESDRLVRLPALARWAAGLAAQLRRHQGEEGSHAFPDLLERVPAAEALVARLDADDRELATVLDEVISVLADLADRRHPFPGAHGRAVAVTDQLRKLLVTHIDDEDANFLPLLERHATREEHAAQLLATAERVPGPDARWLMPWLLASCSDSERIDVRAAAPRRLRVMGRLGAPRYRRTVARAFGPARVWTPSAF